MELKHFSHDKHPLILKNVLEDNRTEQVICKGCEKQILETAYTCRQCNFFLHKICAESPLEITYSMHPEHRLALLATPHNAGEKFFCNVCHQTLKGFIYNCEACEFNIDLGCAFVERGYEHHSHPHPLTLLQRPALFSCDACGMKDEDLSYLCCICPFWIHKSCALSPSSITVKYHNHPLTLAYSLPLDYRSFRLNCGICRNKIYSVYWIYHCARCRYFVHVKCVTLEIKPAGPKRRNIFREERLKKIEAEEGTNSVRFPYIDVCRDLIRPFIKEKSSVEIEALAEIKHFSHEHSLILSNLQSGDTENIEYTEHVCNGCIEPISSRYYSCAQCSYFLDLSCAQLPQEIRHWKHPWHELTLSDVGKDFSFFECNSCKMSGNGFYYGCHTCSFRLDVKCAAMPRTFWHEAHHMHYLDLSNHLGDDISCNACGSRSHGFTSTFDCVVCRFHVDYKCAMLPREVRHRWDRHPLVLTFPPFSDHPDEFYCALCEEEMHPQFWIYHCQECDLSFHPKCIPQLGKFPKIKFGGSIRVKNHPHQLTFVREINFLSSCRSCGVNLDDKLIFQCKRCIFALCHPCACQSSDSHVSTLTGEAESKTDSSCID